MLIGIAANILGVVSAVVSWVRADTLFLALSIIAVALVAAALLRRRNLRLAVTLLSLGCLVLGGTIAVRVDHWITPSAPAVAAPSTPATSTNSTTEAATAVSGSTAPRTLVDTDFVLPRKMAIDVDSKASQAVDAPDGATGKLDFFHDWGQVMSDRVDVVRAPNVFSYSGGALSKAYFTCKGDLEKSPYSFAGESSQFCFVTSDGHPAYGDIRRSRDDHAFVIHVIVWDATAS
ncbi:hypothetical protein D5S17_27175 [Pseudonocardiaceae bacterium YIM PH 21723]|nr:hypothetical protein D5S17_27175 [Pseudonocardiaceae bacterium YIM PH 21723]